MNFPALRIAKKRAFPSHGNALNSIFAVFAAASTGAFRQPDRQHDLRLRLLLRCLRPNSGAADQIEIVVDAVDKQPHVAHN